MAKLRKVNINEGFVVKVVGVIETEDSDKNIETALEELNSLIKKWIENNIASDCTVIVDPVTRYWECIYV